MRVAIVLVVVAAAASARAETVPERATRLFKEGRAMKERGDPGACARFEESYRLVAGAGTGFNVAECLEERGELVRAIELFERIAAEYDDAGRRESADKARGRARALRERVGELVIELPAAAGLVVIVGGQRVSPARTVRRLANPGPVEITASVPGRRPFVTTVTARGGEVETVRVAFEDEVPVVRDSRRRPGRVKLALGLGATGAAALIAGGVLFVQARGLDDGGRHDDAVRRADLATVFGAGGLALAATAAIVFYTAPRDLIVAPVASSDAGGIAVLGRF